MREALLICETERGDGDSGVGNIHEVDPMVSNEFLEFHSKLTGVGWFMMTRKMAISVRSLAVFERILAQDSWDGGRLNRSCF